jgi:hypothetical protein
MLGRRLLNGRVDLKTSASRSSNPRIAVVEAGVCCDPVRLFVLFAYSAFDGFGGPEAVDWAGCGEREQRDRLRYRAADGAAWVCSGEPVLHRSVCVQY